MLAELTALVGAPWLWDAAVRLLLARKARPSAGAPAGEPPERWLVLVPARGEGTAVEATLRSVAGAAAGLPVETVAVLDGADPAAERIAVALAATVVVKAPAGPTKGAALGWAVRELGDRLDRVDAVLVLDVGSTLPAGFFVGFHWSRGAAVVQAYLTGEGDRLGRAVALSERAAQLWQDRGRQALGWAVRLRGTGTVYRPEALRSVAGRLVTAIEDTEAGLLLASAGATVALGPEELPVADVKPEGLGDAARQRSRWLAGQIGLLLRRPGALLRLIARRPLEGLAFAAELLSRPLSLTGVFRLLLGAAWTAWSATHGWPALETVLGAVLLASVAGDAILLRLASGASWPRLAAAVAAMALSWLGAAALLPRALVGWMRGRR